MMNRILTAVLILAGSNLLFSTSANSTEESSKINGYAVLAYPKGENISKINGYAILSYPKGENISKINGYAVLSYPKGESISKMVTYAVLVTIPSSSSGLYFGTDF